MTPDRNPSRTRPELFCGNASRNPSQPVPAASRLAFSADAPNPSRFPVLSKDGNGGRGRMGRLLRLLMAALAVAFCLPFAGRDQ